MPAKTFRQACSPRRGRRSSCGVFSWKVTLRASFPVASMLCWASKSAAAVAADDRKHFARDVTRAMGRRQEHIGGCDFLGLGRALHGRLGTESVHIVRLFVGGIERRPDRP